MRCTLESFVLARALQRTMHLIMSNCTIAESEKKMEIKSLEASSDIDSFKYSKSFAYLFMILVFTKKMPNREKNGFKQLRCSCDSIVLMLELYFGSMVCVPDGMSVSISLLCSGMV